MHVFLTGIGILREKEREIMMTKKNEVKGIVIEIMREVTVIEKGTKTVIEIMREIEVIEVTMREIEVIEIMREIEVIEITREIEVIEIMTEKETEIVIGIERKGKKGSVTEREVEVEIETVKEEEAEAGVCLLTLCKVHVDVMSCIIADTTCTVHMLF